ncbi:chymotrypsinogen 2-like [Ixodes scapularis]|uniref:chymotrypsinogen 2-like n=1 Tax=Ixodes scapularis TaxID=6945 RepID=UPI001A9F6AEB|nr:chymotrypsinogen 2-like [Ixodes scapularis]
MGASVLSMLLLLNGEKCGTSLNKGGRIVGGRNATEGEFPWMVAIQDAFGSHFCGGSIIEPDIVVTAAHCLRGIVPANIQVQAGLLDLNNPPNYSQVRNVQKFAAHESFDMWSNEGKPNDIALLKLAEPFDFGESEGHIGAVCLPAKDRPLEGDVVVTGWGLTSQGNRGLSCYPCLIGAD